MAISTLQNFYKETVAVDCTTGATNIYVSTKPTPINGYLVISPGNESLREIIKYTGTGTDGTGDYVTIALAGDRGLGGTTDQAHIAGEAVRMNYTAEHQQEIDDTINAIVSAGAPNASTTVKGISKLSAAPADAAEPIAVGTNDTRMNAGAGMTADEKAALAGGGDFGAPSATNKFVTEDGFSPTISALYDAVTFPVVEATAVNDAANSDAVSQAVPAGTEVGDVLVVFLYAGTSISSEPSGYTRISTSFHAFVYAKIATGSDTFTCTKNNAVHGWCTNIFRISNTWGSSDITNVVKSEITGNQDLPLNNPDNVYGFYLFIAAVGNTNSGTYSAAPSGYDNFVTVNSGDGDSGEAHLATARKAIRAIEDDPGSFTSSGTTTNIQSVTISIRAAETFLT